MPTRVDPLVRLRELALGLPEAHEVKAWGEPTFRVANKLFAMFAGAHTHHGAGRPAAWIKAEPGEQELRIAADPDRFFRPPYVGPSGWVGVELDRGVDWDDVRELLEAGWRLAAPRKVLVRHEAGAVKQVPETAAKRSRRSPGEKRGRGEAARRSRPGSASAAARKHPRSR